MYSIHANPSQTTCFCYCISKTKNEFGQNPEENIILIGPGRYYTFIACRFVLIRVAYLSSAEAYTNNWDFFGKENYLAFNWWKHFLKILRRSDVTINLTRRLKKMEASEFAPL